MAILKWRLVGPNLQRTRFIVDTLDEVALINDANLGDGCTVGDQILELVFTQAGWVPAGPSLPETATHQTDAVVATTPTLIDIPRLAFTAQHETTYHITAPLLYDVSSTKTGIALRLSSSSAPRLVSGHWLVYGGRGLLSAFESFNDVNVIVSTKSSPFLTGNYALLQATVLTHEETAFSLAFAPTTAGESITITPGSVLRTCVIPPL